MKDSKYHPICATLTMCDSLPSPGIVRGYHLFYFNIRGSMNKKDVKLVALLSASLFRSPIFFPNKLVYFDNDFTNQWQSMKYHSLKWKFNDKYHHLNMWLDFWVFYCIFVFNFHFFSLRCNSACTKHKQKKMGFENIVQS